MPNLRKTGEREEVGGVEECQLGPHRGKSATLTTWLQADPHRGEGSPRDGQQRAHRALLSHRKVDRAMVAGPLGKDS